MFFTERNCGEIDDAMRILINQLQVHLTGFQTFQKIEVKVVIQIKWTKIGAISKTTGK